MPSSRASRIFMIVILGVLVFTYVSYVRYISSLQNTGFETDGMEIPSHSAARVDRLSVATALSNSYYGDMPKWLRHCSKIFLDLGSNIGVTVKKFFQPEKYPKSKILPFFRKKFMITNKTIPSGMCALGFEPNPRHFGKLKAIEKEYSEQNWKVHFFPFAISDKDGYVTLYTTNDTKHEDWGANIYNTGHKNLKQIPVQVKGIRFANFFKTVLKSSQIPLIKMDIEGAEYSVLWDLASEQLLCKEHMETILIEYHKRELKMILKDYEKAMKKLQEYIRLQKCDATEILKFDDETYLHDRPE